MFRIIIEESTAFIQNSGIKAYLELLIFIYPFKNISIPTIKDDIIIDNTFMFNKEQMIFSSL